MAELPKTHNVTSLEKFVNTPTAIPTRQPRALHGIVRNVPKESKLPPAVAAVPADCIRSYVHTKRITSYLVGSTLGEGSFAKVKEGLHILVGEKVIQLYYLCDYSLAMP